MKESAQRKIAMDLFANIPADGLKTRLKECCYGKIFEILKKHKEQVLSIVQNNIDKIPAEWAYQWAYYVGDRRFMKQIVLEKRDPIIALVWDRDVGYAKGMAEIIIASRNPELACAWATKSRRRTHEEEMKEIVFSQPEIGHGGHICEWVACKSWYKEEAINIIIDMKEPEAAYKWICNFGDHSTMIKIIVDNFDIKKHKDLIINTGRRVKPKHRKYISDLIIGIGDPNLLLLWGISVSNDKNIRKALINTNDLVSICKFARYADKTKDIEETILKSGNPYAALYWLTRIDTKNKKMKKMLKRFGTVSNILNEFFEKYFKE